MAIETLAIAIRNHPDIQGVRCGQSTHKCALFADDVLLFLTAPLTTTPNVIRLLNDFGDISGLRVNMSKSVALNVSLPQSQVDNLKSQFPFSWNSTSIPYLGINLTSQTELLHKHNYPPMVKKLMTDLHQWSLYNLSWLGRVNAAKMTLLPKILYLFRSLPIPVTKSYIDSLQSAITKFIWEKKGNRLSKTVLFRPRLKGGLGLPNLWWYYRAAQLSQFSIIYLKGPKPDWVSMEKAVTPGFTLDFLLWNHPRNRPPILAPTLSHSMSLCDSLHKLPSLVSHWHPLAHIFHNSRFQPGLDIVAFKWWLDKGLYRIGHFFNSNGPLTLGYCISKLEMPPSEKFRFYQLSHFLNQIWKIA